MKKTRNILILLLALIAIVCVVAACKVQCTEHKFDKGVCTVCGQKDPNYKPNELPEWVDYVAETKLDMSTSTAKTVAIDVRTYIDGDTTHFNVETSAIANGVLQARYAAINTPESTGKIEEYGQAAKKFTNSKLASAEKILLESPTDKWEADSTGSRYMCWVWYRTSADGEWRNLNLEIMQEGLALQSSTAGSLYGDACVKALNQAKAYKKNIYSGQKDPDMYYGDALTVTLRELRTNIAYYNNKKVSFTGTTVVQNSNGVYVENLDEESGIYFGMYVYYGFNANASLLETLVPGNYIRVVGTVSEFNGTYQVSGIDYIMRDPDNLNNTILIEKGKQAAYTEIDPQTFESFVTLKVNNFDAKPDENGDIDPDEAVVDKQFKLSELMLGSSVTLKDFKVTKVSTTKSEASKSKGAMTLTGECNGIKMTVRTVVLYDENGKLVTDVYFKNKTIDVKGVVDYYDPEGGESGDYQIKLINLSDAVIH